MHCKICQNNTNKFTKDKILNKYIINYYHCPECKFIQTEEPYWLEEAYNESINITDTGIMRRNQMLSNFTSVIILLFFNKNSKFLDFAGGYGIFTRLMRDIGFDFYWNDKYSQNLVSRGFEFNIDEKYNLLTSFESFEHFIEPMSEIENMLKISDNILFSTTLVPNEIPLPNEWEYYGLEHGQHISFYSIKTMEYIAYKYKLNFYTNGKNIHFFTKKKINKYAFKILYILSRLGLNNITKLFSGTRIISDSKLLREEMN